MEHVELVSTSACENPGRNQTDLFSLEVKICVISETGTKIQIVKVSNVQAYSCLCVICEKRFLAKSSLKTHMKIHVENENNSSPDDSAHGTISSITRKFTDREDIISQPDYSCFERENHAAGRVKGGTKGTYKVDDGVKHTKSDDPVLPNNDTVSITSRNSFHSELTSADDNRQDVRDLNKNNSPNRTDGTDLVSDLLTSEQKFKTQKTSTLKCHICGIEVLGGKHELNEHVNRHTGEKPYVCHACGRGYDSQSQLDVHARIHNEDLFTCPECGKQFTKSNLLRAHSIIHKGKPFPCTVCGKQFRQKFKVKEHMLTHTGEKPHECAFCGKAFSRSSNLKCHMMIHTGNKPHRCITCGKTFATTSNLKAHMNLHKEEKPYLCTVCGKRFTQLVGFDLHVTTHNRSFSCSLCERAFKYEGSLKQHVKINHEENSLTCEVCGKMFRHYIYLKGHLRTHEKPYTCLECGKSFSNKSPFDNHMRIHTGEKPYECSNCGQTFRLRRSLMEHVKEQHDQYVKVQQGESNQPLVNTTTYIHSNDLSSGSDLNWNVGSLIDVLTNV